MITIIFSILKGNEEKPKASFWSLYFFDFVKLDFLQRLGKNSLNSKYLKSLQTYTAIKMPLKVCKINKVTVVFVKRLFIAINKYIHKPDTLKNNFEI